MSESQGSAIATAPVGLSSDINAGFAFLLDCVVNIFVLSAILASFGFPLELIQSRIIPGCIAGIAIGNGLMVWHARKTARETGNPNLTAMPLGLDMPTTIGLSFSVYMPVFFAAKASGLDAMSAGELTWAVGMGLTILMGLIKFVLSYFAISLQRVMPVAALLGSMMGIAIVWLGAAAMMGILDKPEVGILSLVIMVFALTGGHALPFKLPGAVIAIVFGTLIYYILAYAGVGGGYVIPNVGELNVAFPMPTLAGFDQIFDGSLNALAVGAPLALLIALSAVNVATGAKLLGDDLNPRHVIQLDAVATTAGALFGGIIQTTPYFGHTTYKRMGGRWLYSAGAASVIFIGGISGVIGLLVNLLPDAAIKPILIVVASDIVRLTYANVPSRHGAAIAFAVFPGILNFTYVMVSDLYGQVQRGIEKTGTVMTDLVSSQWVASYDLLSAMAKGYVLTSLLWAAAIAFLIDRQMKSATAIFALCGIFASFGIVHSVLPNSGIYLPWDASIDSALSTRLAGAYFIAAFMTFALSFSKGETIIEE